MPKSIAISKIEGQPGQVYYPLRLEDVPDPIPKGSEVVVKMHAAALNHRDHYIRQHLYPGVAFDVPQLADGCGTVVKLGPDADAKWNGKRVIIAPAKGWQDSVFGPEVDGKYGLLGGTSRYRNGTLQEYMVIDESELEEAPEHLTDVEAAAFPVTGLTAWRAVMVKCAQHIGPGKNVLVTGIGGGVALMALAFAKAAGTNVYVTSGSEQKLRDARSRGAAGGVNYKEDQWEKKLLEMTKGVKLDAIIDGAGGNIVEKAIAILRPGGVIAVYGMTMGPQMTYLMSAVMRNIEIRGSTMGSRKEFGEMVRFIKENRVYPVVSRVAQGLDIAAIEELYKEIEKGAQFGKLVVQISSQGRSSRL